MFLLLMNADRAFTFDAIVGPLVTGLNVMQVAWKLEMTAQSACLAAATAAHYTLASACLAILLPAVRAL